MRTATDVELQSVVLHWVRPRQGKPNPELSELELPVVHLPPEVHTFLTHHIARTLQDPVAQAATFDDQNPALASGQVDRLFPSAGDDEFLDASQALVTQLFEIMAGDGRIKDGTIVVARFGVRIDGEAETYVAILKLDPSNQYRSTMVDYEGKARLELSIVSGILPSNEARLQKAAVFRRFNESDEYQLLLVDRQVDGYADWFVRGFLAVSPSMTDEQRTKGFNRGVEIGIQKLETKFDIAPETATAIAVARDVALEQGTVTVDDWVSNQSRLSGEERDLLRSEITKKVPDPQFRVDASADPGYGTTSFVGSDGLRVSINSDAADRIDAERSPVTGVWTVTITTDDWRQR